MIKFLFLLVVIICISNKAYSDELDEITTDITNELEQQPIDINSDDITNDINNELAEQANEITNTNNRKKLNASRDIANAVDQEFSDDDFSDSDIEDDIKNSLEDDELRPKQNKANNNRKRVYRGKVTPYSKGEKLIDHPLANKGLYKITKDLTYLYKINKSEQKHSASVRFGMFDPINLTTEEGDFLFSDLYDNSEGPMLLVDYEWQYKFLGKFSLKAGSGFYFAQGNGRFNSSNAPAGATPLEDFTLIMFPNSFNTVYKLQFWDEQLIVPYAEAGLDAYTFMEIQEGGDFPKFGGSLGGHFSLGASLSLNFLDQWSILELDRDYGINGVSLIGEYRNFFHITGAYDFSGNMINGGIAIDF